MKRAQMGIRGCEFLFVMELGGTIQPRVHKPSKKKKLGDGLSFKKKNSAKECGKGFLFIKLKLSKGLKKVNLCAMSTHMSKKGTAFYRASLLNEAYQITQTAECGATVFIGDFNSRLHCQIQGQSFSLRPMFSRCQPLPKGGFTEGCQTDHIKSPLQYIIHKFCKERKGSEPWSCQLGAQGPEEKKEQADEMVQLLQKNDIVQCYEGSDSLKLESFNKAPQYDYQWKELSQTPAFIPTYRVSNGCGDEGPWNMKINDQLCWKSSQKKEKNNPAWPDRILVGGGNWQTDKYTAQVSKFATSDHLPVIGKMELMVP